MSAKILLPILLLVLSVPCCFCLPLSTKGKWIVDSKTGERVKLACVNWPSHLEPMLAEGLADKPLKQIVFQIVRGNYNCVRFTWATFMFTRYANLTVRESFNTLNLTETVAEIRRQNGFILEKTLPQAFETVIDELGRQGVMVILDCQVSKPTWCCGEKDGNAFFGDEYFDVEEWLQGLTTAAELAKGKPNVIGISTRNELRGPLSNVDNWYKYITQGAEAIHKANPDAIILASGLSYANDLTFLKNQSLRSNYDNKLVYEAHWYPWSWAPTDTWDDKNINQICQNKLQHFIDQTGFVNTLKNPVPLFLGEFGLNLRGLLRSQDHFLSCFLAYASDIDLDWAIWGLQGNYYFRSNKIGMDETFGVLDYHWNRIRNPHFENRLKLIKQKLQEPSSDYYNYYIMFHPQSGSCVLSSSRREVYTESCSNNPSQWFYAGDGHPIRLKGTDLCIEAVGDGVRPILSENCHGPQSSWKLLSETKLHVGVFDQSSGQYLCLQKDSPYTSTIITTKCHFTLQDTNCLEDPQDDPTTQWFKLVTTNVRTY
ncbi:glycosyl hydrolase 5 family protein [Jatropha curcas]|uniref:glycosyl hydrolase 5 family protein n=1 Tax=Jatropha curcas TaxID=180498 RepID=UPI0005FB8726|nr:glycosyl hydrolase 5 family protein [Jatropha curcas]